MMRALLVTPLRVAVVTAVFGPGRRLLGGVVSAAGAGVVVAVSCGDVGMVIHGHLQGPAATQLASGVASGELAWGAVHVAPFELVESDGGHVSAMIDGVLGSILGF